MLTITNPASNRLYISEWDAHLAIGSTVSVRAQAQAAGMDCSNYPPAGTMPSLLRCSAWTKRGERPILGPIRRVDELPGPSAR